MPRLCEKKKCTGCASCLSVCRHNAITFTVDEYGFSYPVVNEVKCVNCKHCERKCPVLNKQEYHTHTMTYACYVNDKNERLMSSSGGIATVLATYFIKRKGVVYGCAFVPPMQVKHIRCTTLDDIQKLRGSKYVQSDVSEILPCLENDLRQGKEVLFIGTPCQIAGVISNFGQFKNLTTVDLVCHGVPSMQFLCDTLPKKICKGLKDEIGFRINTNFHLFLRRNGSIIYERALSKDLFFKGFFTGILFRPSCFTCLYATPKRVSDITIGDFWGLKSNKILDINNGVSLTLVNTEKGTEIFECVKDKLVYEQHSLDEAIKDNAQLSSPFRRSYREVLFKKLYPKVGYLAAIWSIMPDRLIGTRMKAFLKDRL